jgi:hypothetical protein
LKKIDAIYKPNRIDHRKIFVQDKKAAGVNTNYGVGGGQASYMAQGKGTGVL